MQTFWWWNKKLKKLKHLNYLKCIFFLFYLERLNDNSEKGLKYRFHKNV